MFKNRIRTAALAGAIAVATGVSGMAVPAYAQNGFNPDNGTASAPVTAQDITEQQLRDATDLTDDYLDGFQNANTLEDVVDAYINLGADGFDPSEQAARDAFAVAQGNTATELATSAQNIQDARASVAFALEQDQNAEAEWAAFVETLQGAVDSLNPKIEAANAANEFYSWYEFQELETLDDATTENAVELHDAIIWTQNEVNEQWEQTGHYDVDQAEWRYITREHQAALDALKAEFDIQAPAVTTAFDSAKDANREAQRSDVLVRQIFLERATAQRDTLRVIDGIFSAAARYVELSVSDELTDEGVLSTQYREVQNDLREGLDMNLNWLDLADDAAEEFYLSWWTDLSNPEEGDAYDADKLRFATETYENIYLNGAVWGEALREVNLLDERIVAEREQEAADREQTRKDAEDAAKKQQELIDAINGTHDDEGETPGDDDSNLSSGSSENGGLFGILAAVGGVIALIAAAFPFISNFMR